MFREQATQIMCSLSLRVATGRNSMTRSRAESGSARPKAQRPTNPLTLRYRHSAAFVRADGRIPLAALTRQPPVLSGARSSRTRLATLARHWTSGRAPRASRASTWPCTASSPAHRTDPPAACHLRRPTSRLRPGPSPRQPGYAKAMVHWLL